MTINRKWKDTYALSTKVIARKGWELKAYEVRYADDSQWYVVYVELPNGGKITLTKLVGSIGDNQPVTTHFKSFEELQSFIDNKNKFIMSREKRSELLANHYANEVLSYSVEKNDRDELVVLATWDDTYPEIKFFELGKLFHGFDLSKAHGKTVSEVSNLIDGAMINEETMHIQSFANYYYGTPE